MDLYQFSELYVLQWNPVTDHYWCGTVTEALMIGAHNYGQRETILALKDKTDFQSVKTRNGLGWIWVAVAEDPSELWDTVNHLKADGRQPDDFQCISLVSSDSADR